MSSVLKFPLAFDAVELVACRVAISLYFWMLLARMF